MKLDILFLGRSAATHFLRTPPKWAVGLFIALLCLLAFGLRCLHLFRDDHYFIVSADSHYFHRMAELLTLDDTYFYPTQNRLLPVPAMSGITHPLAVLARATALITPASPLDGLELASKLLPPILGLVTVIVVWFAVSRVYGRSVGTLSALVWALLPMGIFFQAAGYLDRDGLSILLVIVGVFSFFMLRGAHVRIGSRDLGWMASAAAVVSVEAILYIEWGFLGPTILLSVLVAFVVVQLLSSYINQAIPALFAEDNVLRWPAVMLKGMRTSFRHAVRESSLRPLTIILLLNMAAVALRPGTLREMYRLFEDALRGSVLSETTVGEMQGLSSGDILAYGLLLVPIAVGIYVALKRRRQADLLVLSWFAVLFVAGLLSRRLFLYAAPALCITASLGFVALLDIKGLRFTIDTLGLALVDPRPVLTQLRSYLRVGCGGFLLLATIATSTLFAYSFASLPPTAANTEWDDALTWLRQETPEDTVVMTWWDYGYWVLDIAHRVPVVDNGYHPEATDRDIAHVYSATENSEAASIMRQYGATYLIFSKVETRIIPVIAGMAGIYVDASDLGEGSVPPELEYSLYNRSFGEDFASDEGLRRVFLAGQSSESEVVILALQ